MQNNYHVKGYLGSEFEDIVDLWISKGKLTFNEVKEAKSLNTSDDPLYILPGLVDAHVHLTIDFDKLFNQKPPDTSYLTHEYILERKNKHLHAGELLIRDIGEFKNMHHERFGVEHPVTLQAAGRFLAPENGFFSYVESTRPENLIEEALKQLKLGYQWIKIIGSWAKIPLNYDKEIIYSLVKEVHKAGGRVAIHAETKESATVAVNVGIDSIEHGIFLTKEQIDQMADNKIAWTPTAAMYYDDLPKYPDDVFLKSTWNSLKELIPYAQEQGISIMTGTDMFPPGSVHLEIEALVELGLTVEQAVQAATTIPRKFLNQHGIEEGASADIVLYHKNPINDLNEINKPNYVIAKGQMFRNI